MTLIVTYLLAAFLGGLGARLLRLPPLLGFLVAGFALAAFGVENHAMIDTMAQLGVALLLFGIGLHLDIRQLARREVWATAVLHTSGMVLIGAGLLAALGALGLGLLAGMSLTTLALIAFALSFSSTVFVIKILEERGATRSRYGMIAIGILVVQDLFAVGFVAASSGHLPSPWALTLLLLFPGRRLIIAIWDRLGHGEILVVFAVFLALLPGYFLFEAVGLEGDLGAIAIGMLLASHPRSDELSKSIFSVKELMLVAFFLSIGLQGLPSLSQIGLGLLLLLLLSVQSLGYFVVISWFGMRRRTAILAALVLANNSEFALIVDAVAIKAGLLDEQWLTIMSVAVAVSFVIGTVLNLKADAIADAVEARWPDTDPERLDPGERPVPLDDIDVLVLGMGRVGRACYLRLVDAGRKVLGIEHDEERVAVLRADGIEVLHGDATDAELWRRLTAVTTLRKVILAMPFHHANLDALRVVRSKGFTGMVAAIAQWADDRAELIAEGADEVLHLYTGAGAALADAALGDTSILRSIRQGAGQLGPDPSCGPENSEAVEAAGPQDGEGDRPDEAPATSP